MHGSCERPHNLHYPPRHWTCSVQSVLDCYYPGRGFPSVSVTGRSCSLRCRHCAGRYLEGMVPATEPDELLSFASSLSEAGGKGFLLSGGSDVDGRVRLERFVPAIKRIKSSTQLKVNAHVGLAPRESLRELVEAGVDSFSVDLYGDDETVREVLGIGASSEEYFSVVRDLMDLGAGTVAPHVCVGVKGGEMSGEMAALRRLGPISPSTLVIISFIPTRGTDYESRRPPSGEDVVSFVKAARSSLPRTRIVLGCMRSRRDRSWELDAVLAGLDGIALPSEETVRAAAAKGITIRRKDTCCALG